MKLCLLGIMTTAEDDIDAFLQSVYPRHFLESDDEDTSEPERRPFVTLTYAQSLDAKIAGKAGKQLLLSGKESMAMTHRYVFTQFSSGPLWF